MLQKKHGIPKEQIVLMMYDDIAHNRKNPFKWKTINVTGKENLYTDDIVKNYTGKDVTPSNFMKVLLGDEKLKKSGKKVLESNENDHVFVFFSDHGGPGIIAFPDEQLYASDLIKTLKEMIYVWQTIRSKFKNYAVTTANPTESSYAKYLDEERNTYLADEFSVNWVCKTSVTTFKIMKKKKIISVETEELKKIVKNYCKLYKKSF